MCLYVIKVHQKADLDIPDHTLEVPMYCKLYLGAVGQKIIA